MSTPMIHKKMIDLMRDISAIGKTSRHEEKGFSFRGVDDIYNHLHPLFRKHGVFMTVDVIGHSTLKDKTLVDVKYTFFAEDGSSVASNIKAEAIDQAGDGTTKAMSIAQRTCLTQMFLIPTGEILTDELFKKAMARIYKGEAGLYDKLNQKYQLTAEQRSKLLHAVKQAKP